MHQTTGGKRRKTRKSKKGGYYSFNGALATGAADWSRQSEMAPEVAGRGGNAQMGGKKKRKTLKRKSRKAKRGGGKWGGVAASFAGTGERGLGNYSQIPSGRAEAGSPSGGEFNNFGAQPGSGFGSFIKAA